MKMMSYKNTILAFTIASTCSLQVASADGTDRTNIFGRKILQVVEGDILPKTTSPLTQKREVKLRGRTFIYQLESIEIENNAPVIKGWMCRVGDAANTSSSVITNNSILSSTNLLVRADRSLNETCGFKRFDLPKTDFKLQIKASLNDEITFQLHHLKSRTSERDRIINLGTLRSLLSEEQLNALLDYAASVEPTISIYSPDSGLGKGTITVRSRETFVGITPNSKWCAERAGGNNCVEDESLWVSQEYFSFEQKAEENGSCSMASLTDDFTCIHSLGEFADSRIQKVFRPAEFFGRATSPYTVTIYYENSFGRRVSANMDVNP